MWYLHVHFVCAKLFAIRDILSVFCFGGLNNHHSNRKNVSLLKL